MLPAKISELQFIFCTRLKRKPFHVIQVVTVPNVVAARLCFHRRLSFCSQEGGGGVSQHVLGRHPQADTSLSADTPLWADTPSGQTPLWADTPLGRHPRADTPPGRPPCPVHARIHTPPAATAADGTHPTGMHSCFNM